MKPQQITVAAQAPCLDIHTGEIRRLPGAFTTWASKVGGWDSYRFVLETRVWSVGSDYVTTLQLAITVEFQRRAGDVWVRETCPSKEKAVSRIKALRRRGYRTRFVT